MKKDASRKMCFPPTAPPDTSRSASGFTLAELMIAMAVFLIVSAAAFSLFNQQQTTFLRQDAQTGINIALRNAISQMQIDVSNAGTAFFQGANIPAWPVGVTIVNSIVPAGNSCYNPATFTYTAQCFDVLNIISGADPATYPPINATDSTGGATTSNCSDTSTGTAYGRAATGLTLAQTAANFSSGDQVLFLTLNGKKMTSVVLTSAPTVTGASVQFLFRATNADGTNTLANDPLDITACDNNPCPTPNNFGKQFCGNDWILKLAPITYKVDSSNPSNPRLMRIVNSVLPGDTVMEQVIGLKVGATIWNTAINTVSTQYNYDASSYAQNVAGDQAWNFTLVRSLRISLIGRTTPATNPSYTFRNLFDSGPYQVEGISVVINPRNMSMND